MNQLRREGNTKLSAASRGLLCILLVGVALFPAIPCLAAAAGSTLKVGIGTEPMSLDPHASVTASVISLCSNIFDGLVFVDEDLKTGPGLAEKWETPDPFTWIFYLKKNVKFHDGSPFSAEDVKFSIDRAKNWEKSRIKSRVRFIKGVEILDAYTVKITTEKPFPLLARFLYWVPIMSKGYVQAQGQEAQSDKPNGTGPYKLKEWVKGGRFLLTANDAYVNGTPPIKTVEIRPLTNDATRTAALLSGEVQLIDNVPVRDTDRIKHDNRFELLTKQSTRCIYIYMDQSRKKSPKITGIDNPFLNKDVRKAVAMAINKQALVDYIMNGFGVPAGQMYPATVTGSDPGYSGAGHDLDTALALMKKAGYEKGFEVVFDSTNDDFANDEQIAQAIASQLAKIHIRLKINAAPKKIIYSLQGGQKSSFGTSYWTSTMGDAIRFLDNCAHSFAPDKGLGRWNIGRYANTEADALIETSGQSMDPEVRNRAMQKAQRIFLDEQGFIPLYFPVNIYATRAGLHFVPSATTNLMYSRMRWEQ